MKVQTVKCLKCGDEIYSRARHDFRWCSCHSVAVDGGRDYTKICGEPTEFITGSAEVDVTDLQLFEDWNRGENKYGKVLPKK